MAKQMKNRAVKVRPGDRGETCGAGGMGITKDEATAHLIGNLDELQAHIQLLSEKYYKQVPGDFAHIQNHIFQLGASVYDMEARISQDEIGWLELRTDQMWAGLPELKNFVIPYPGDVHLARAVCRRVERAAFAVKLGPIGFPFEKGIDADEYAKIVTNLRTYLNRLSDYLFVMARFVNQMEGKIELVWVDKKEKQ